MSKRNEILLGGSIFIFGMLCIITFGIVVIDIATGGL
jgi:hypothetical protein